MYNSLRENAESSFCEIMQQMLLKQLKITLYK